MIRRVGVFVALIGLSLIPGMARAQATRTWVSGVGDDANPCSRTAPCKTFAGAISKTAAGGEINALDPGGFGAVTITKAITIDGGGGQIASVLVSGTNGIVVNAGASDVVTIRNIQLEGLGTGLSGISFLNGAALHVQRVAIRGFGGVGIDFRPSGNAKLFVSDSSVLHSGAGIQVHPSGGASFATIVDTTLSGNASFGLRAEGNSSTVAKNVTADGNINGFIAIDFSGALPLLSIDACVASHNSNAGVAAGFGGAGSAKVLLSNTSIFENANGLSFDANGQIQSYGNNRVFGNGLDGTPSGTIPHI